MTVYGGSVEIHPLQQGRARLDSMLTLLNPQDHTFPGRNPSRRPNTVRRPSQPCPPSGQDLARNPVVQRALHGAWQDSEYGTPQRHEEGGWIYSRNGRLLTRRAPPGTQSSLNLDNPPRVRGAQLVGTFHVHPNPTSSYWAPEPQAPDFDYAYKQGLPGVVLTDQGIYTFGPERRGSDPGRAAPPGWNGFPGSSADTRGCTPGSS